MSSFEGNIVPIRSLYESISKWVSEEECFKFFEREFNDYDKNWIKDRKEDHWRNSLPRKLLQVYERIKLTDTLHNDLRPESSVIKKISYPSLITYLRLTCFDQLGQPNSWMTFNNWLNSKKSKDERQRIISKIQGEDKVKFSEELYLGYQKIYGVKNSFYRFLNEILPKEIHYELLSKIKIVIYNDFEDDIHKRYKGRTPTIVDKESYLYQIRNDYTHNTFSTGPIFDFEPKNKDANWRTRDSIYIKRKEYLSISTSYDFEDYLREVVLIGVAEIIKQ